MEEFLTVGQQVLILFILIITGVLCQKSHLVSESAVKGVTNIVLYCVTPCVLIKSFADIPFSSEKLTQLILVFLIVVLLHVGMIALAFLLVHDQNDARQRMFRFAVIFSNAGFMGLPLQEALLGEEGTFFGSAYIAVFNITVWTFGLYLMSGDKKDISPKKALFSPGVIGVLIGVLVFLAPLVIPQFEIPALLFTPIKHLANLNTPLPMLIIGFYLAEINFSVALRDLKCLLIIFLRMVAIPLLALGILYLCGLRGTMLISIIISISTPTAAITTMFAAKYDRHPHTSCNIVSLSTLVSVISMPLIVGLAEILA